MILYNGTIEVPDVRIDYEKCDLCLNCMRECPMQHLRLKEKMLVPVEEVCFGCRHCEVVCERGAISVHGFYRIIANYPRIGYIPLKGWPEFKALAKDKEKVF